VARNIEDIQQDIERTRRQLAGTLDRLAYRTRPQTIVEDAKKSALQRLQEPQVKQSIQIQLKILVNFVSQAKFGLRYFVKSDGKFDVW